MLALLRTLILRFLSRNVVNSVILKGLMDVMKMEFANAKKMLKAQIVITAWMVSMAFQIVNLVSVMKKGQMD